MWLLPCATFVLIRARLCICCLALFPGTTGKPKSPAEIPLSCVCYECARLNAEACKLCQPITNWRHIEKLFVCVRSFYLCNANTYCWNIEADRDIRVSARCLILGLHTQPGDGFCCQLYQWICLAAHASRSLTKYIDLCV